MLHLQNVTVLVLLALHREQRPEQRVCGGGGHLQARLPPALPAGVVQQQEGEARSQLLGLQVGLECNKIT